MSAQIFDFSEARELRRRLREAEAERLRLRKQVDSLHQVIGCLFDKLGIAEPHDRAEMFDAMNRLSGKED